MASVEDALLLPEACFGRGRAVARRTEALWGRVYECGETNIKHRHVGSSPVVVRWSLPFLPDDECFFLPLLGQFLTGNLRPRFDGEEQVGPSEDALLSVLAGNTLSVAFLLASYESSVRSTLPVFRSLENDLGAAVLESIVAADGRRGSLKEALLEQWSAFIREWGAPPQSDRGPVNGKDGPASSERWSALLEAMTTHQRCDRSAHVARCWSYVRNDPLMSLVRELDSWERRFETSLKDCDDAQLRYLSECRFWSYARMTSDAPAFARASSRL